jgi:hypothetical protein
VHTLNADDAGRLRSGCRFCARHAGQPLAEQFDSGTAAGIVGQRAVEPIVGTHELRGEQGRRLVVERSWCTFLCDKPSVEQHHAIGDRHGLDLVMRDVDSRQAQRDDQRAQPGSGFLAQLGIEI